MKKIDEFRNLTQTQIRKRLEDAENELLIEQSKKGSGGRAFNPGKIRKLKKMRAVIYTILNEKKEGSGELTEKKM